MPRACVWTQARLLDWLDGALLDAAAQTLQAHLETCDACRQELSRCRRAEQALRASRAAIPAPGDLRADFYARLADAPAPPRFGSRWTWALPACAGLLLAAVWWRGSMSLLPLSGARPTDGAVSETSPPPLNRPHSAPAPTIRASGTKLPPVPPQNVPPQPRPAAPRVHQTMRTAQQERPLSPREMRTTASVPAQPVAPVHSDAMGRDSKAESRLRLERDLTVSTPLRRAQSEKEVEALADARDVLSRFAETTETREMLRGEPAAEEVNLRVHDDARGFTATVRVASVVEETADGAVLTIEAEGFPEDLGTP